MRTVMRFLPLIKYISFKEPRMRIDAKWEKFHGEKNVMRQGLDSILPFITQH